MIEETFFLYPPAWLNNPPKPKSTALFKTYAAKAPSNTWPANTSTHQGLYCMTAEGDYLSGKFARQSNEVARTTLTGGLSQLHRVARERGYRPQPIPTDRLDLYGGDPLQKGGLKLEVTYRDFPRGHVQRPGEARFPNPYNMGWHDFSPEDALHFLGKGSEKTPLPEALVANLARHTFKDAVRGQMADWKEQDIRLAELYTESLSKDGSLENYRLSGSIGMANERASYEAKLFGLFTYDHERGEFTNFRLIASGQRGGRGNANGRETDLGPAPMGIALELYRP